jgi:hypothetical protein
MRGFRFAKAATRRNSERSNDASRAMIIRLLWCLFGKRTEDLAAFDGSQPLCSPLDVALSPFSTQTIRTNPVSYHQKLGQLLHLNARSYSVQGYPDQMAQRTRNPGLQWPAEVRLTCRANTPEGHRILNDRSDSRQACPKRWSATNLRARYSTIHEEGRVMARCCLASPSPWSNCAKASLKRIISIFCMSGLCRAHNVLNGKARESVEEVYQKKAIGVSIPLLSSRSEPWRDEILLATTIILRMSEQFSELGNDIQHHLNVAFSLYGTSHHRWSPFQTDVRGVAFWVYLRESIHICFLYEQGCPFDMGLIEDEAPNEGPDEVWTNRMTYFLARVCNACGGNFPGDTAVQMATLRELVDRRKSNLPETFEPWASYQENKSSTTILVVSTWHFIGYVPSIPYNFDTLIASETRFGKCSTPAFLQACRFTAQATRETCPYLEHNMTRFPARSNLKKPCLLQSLRRWQQYYSAKVMLAIYAKPQNSNSSFLALNQYMHRGVTDPARQLCGICFSCDDIASETNGSEINASHLTS